MGVRGVEEVIDREGEMRAFRTFQNQPQHRDGGAEAQLRRFMGTYSGRKKRYGRLLAESVDDDSIPPPLEALIDHIRSWSEPR